MFISMICRVKAFNSGNSIRPPQGPKKVLCADDEKAIVMYLEECWKMRVPKQQDILAYEIVHYMECNQIQNKFPNTVPGKFE